MPTERIHARLGISKLTRHPYYRVQVLGPRSTAQPGELVVPVVLTIDSALLNRITNTVAISMPDLQPVTHRENVVRARMRLTSTLPNGKVQSC